jgi:hypothetical protein
MGKRWGHGENMGQGEIESLRMDNGEGGGGLVSYLMF